jgi:glycyl-tRNA synthetase beta chain
MASEFLVEVGTEELPPRALARLSKAFGAGLVSGLEEARLAHGAVDLYATPRRLAVRVAELADRQPDVETELKGPPVRIAFDADGKPTRAAEAFAGKCGVAVADLQRIETPKGDWLMHRGTESGRPAAELLPELVGKALSNLPIPKRMRWGSRDEDFVRPVHWVVMLLGADIVPATLFGIPAGRETRGHRFHAPGPVTLNSASDYPAAIEDGGYVMADFENRRQAVENTVLSAAASRGGSPVYDEALLEEVTALVEWPVPVAASFEARFLDLPAEVLVATLQSHQRYFPLRGPDGRLMSDFVAVANLESKQPDAVREGNERVVRPRLADAAFFWDQDRRTPLADRQAGLEHVVFQRDLGTVADKARRVAALAAHIAGSIGADPALARRAAELAKCDLLTEMVGEFPELQGIMGRYYAAHDGEDPAVAAAIDEQYRPRFAGDDLPETAAGVALAMADKLDTLAGIFAIGQRPTGTKDPFGLRRAALGILRMLIEGRRQIDLDELIGRAVEQIPGAGDRAETIAGEVFDYMMDRLRAYYVDGAGEITAPPDVFEAVMANRPPSPLDFHERVLAVLAFQKLDAAGALSAANKRVANILRKSGDEAGATPDPDKLEAPEEIALYEHLHRIEPQLTEQMSSGQYTESLVTLAALREPVDAFFDAVMVMDEDAAKRRNRLALLARMRALFGQTADLSRLAG